MNEIAIIGGASCVGGFITSCIYGWVLNLTSWSFCCVQIMKFSPQLADKFGRKLALISLGIPQVCGWLLVYFAQNSYYLIFARLLHGFGGGGELWFLFQSRQQPHLSYSLFTRQEPTLLCHFSSRKSPKTSNMNCRLTELNCNLHFFSIRGRLGSLLILFCNIGILGVYVLGAFIDYHITAVCLLMVTNVFFASVLVIHDSPIYLLKKSRFKVRTRSLAFRNNFSSQSVLTASGAVTQVLSGLWQQSAAHERQIERGVR
jgi:MFS family permease